MTDLSAATAILNPADILSLLPLLGNAPAASTGFSVCSPKDFSAVLTELTGPGDNEPASSTPVAPAQAIAALPPTQAATAVAPEIACVDPASGSRAATKVAPTKAPGGTVVISSANATIPFSPAAIFTVATTNSSPSALQTHIPSSLSKPELEQAFADVKTFTYSVTEETAKQPVVPPAPTPSQAVAVPLAAEPEPKQVATDAKKPECEIHAEASNQEVVASREQPLAMPPESGPTKADVTPAAPHAVTATRAPQPEPEQQTVSEAKQNLTVPLEQLVATASVKTCASKPDETPTAPEAVTAPSAPEPQPAQIVRDVKNPESAVPAQRPKESAVEQHVQPETEPATMEPPRAAPVTTDAITNVQQQLLPLRIIAVQKVVSESKPTEKNKQGAAPSPGDPNATTPASQVSDLIRPVDRMERPVAAHPVEIPNIPHIPVVRTVSMEVGDSDSQVTIRIQERGGDIALQLSAGCDALRRDLQSSAGSLEQALRQDHVQVSTIEVSRKSPIDKVRRMKEAR